MNRIILSLVVSCIFPLLAVEYKVRDYKYLIEKMPKIDSGLQEIHFKLYEGYVNQVNLLNKLLENMGADSAFTFQAIKRQMGWEFDGMVLHELFFSNLGGDGKLSPNSVTSKKIKQQWGSYEKWMEEFKETCNERGIGWTILYYDPDKDLLINAWISEHSTGLFATATPLLVVDLWEHAYLCQFKTDRNKYVDTVFEYIDWGVVNDRMKNAPFSSRAKELRKERGDQMSLVEKTLPAKS